MENDKASSLIKEKASKEQCAALEKERDANAEIAATLKAKLDESEEKNEMLAKQSESFITNVGKLTSETLEQKATLALKDCEIGELKTLIAGMRDNADYLEKRKVSAALLAPPESQAAAAHPDQPTAAGLLAGTSPHERQCLYKLAGGKDALPMKKPGKPSSDDYYRRLCTLPVERIRRLIQDMQEAAPGDGAAAEAAH